MRHSRKRLIDHRCFRLLMLALLIGACKPTQQITERNCGTMNGYDDRMKSDATFARNEELVENKINQYLKTIRSGETTEFRSGVIVIPVVVHVVYSNSTENISDAQIQSQIDVLNEDYRRLNADRTGVPSAFTSLVADARIEFRLAARDPDCNPTNGITRTSTDETSFDFDPLLGTATARNPVKFDSSGGKDGWPSDEYLNFWVCDLTGTLLGYGSFPSDLAARPTEDGVVMDYAYFGNIGTATAPFDLGRTTTHEVGHWLNLQHIWGDDQNEIDTCSGSDLVSDTPNQSIYNYGCPTHPQNTCGSDDMFMNFMDYVDDDCMIMFSNGQSDRMDAVLYSTRASIVSSQGDVPPPSITQDLFSRDMADDFGEEPNITSSSMYKSDDIWVRNSNDGFTNQEHQNANGGATNYVYVRVRNRGCGTASSANVKLYWAKAGSGLSWPSPWDGSVTSPALMGELIGQQPTGSMTSSGFEILEYEWMAPDPADYSSFGADNKHFCLLSRIETSPTAPFGMTFPETTNLGENVRNNNNIVWKNITVAESTSGGRFAAVLISNYTKTADKYKIVFEVPKGEKLLFDFGKVKASLGEKLFKLWEEGGKVSEGVEFLGKSQFMVLENGAYLDNIALRPNQSHAINLKFEPDMKQLKYERNIFNLDMLQYTAENNSFVGAQTFMFRFGQ